VSTWLSVELGRRRLYSPGIAQGDRHAGIQGERAAAMNASHDFTWWGQGRAATPAACSKNSGVSRISSSIVNNLFIDVCYLWVDCDRGFLHR